MGFEALTTMGAADNAFSDPLYPSERDMAQAALRDRWNPEMRQQLQKAGAGDQDAIKTVARGLSKAGLTVDATFEDGLNGDEIRTTGAVLDRHRDGQRTQAGKPKAQRDETLKEFGWDQPDHAKAVKEGQFNQVLLDWTGADLLATGVAIEDCDISTR